MTEHEALLKLSALCSRSEHSSGEMMDKMRRWQLPGDARERVLARLVDERFVDDERFSRFFVRDKIRFDRWGRRKIEQALARKGVDKDVAQRVLDEFTDADYADQLSSLLSAKRRSLKGVDGRELNAKLIRYALGRGFGYDIIRRCLDAGSDDYSSDSDAYEDF